MFPPPLAWCCTTVLLITVTVQQVRVHVCMNNQDLTIHSNPLFDLETFLYIAWLYNLIVLPPVLHQ